jgi:hypothetical protein
MPPNKYIQFKCSEKIMNKNHKQRLVSIIIHFFSLEAIHVLFKLQLSLQSGKREGNVLQSHPPTHQLLYFIWLVLLWGNQYQPRSQEKNLLPMTSWATVLLCCTESLLDQLKLHQQRQEKSLMTMARWIDGSTSLLYKKTSEPIQPQN